MREIDADAQIGIVDRGYGSEIATFREEGVHSLLSGNLMDVCPVGAITTRDYRFKSRPWDNPGVVDTICTLCSKGCNTSSWLKAKPEWAKGARLIRMTPRFNPDVNSYWMCDIGRFNYHWIEGDTRLRRPMLRSGARPRAARRGTTSSRGCATASRRPARPIRRRCASSCRPMRPTEELFVLKETGRGPARARTVLRRSTVTWTRTEKPQPPGRQVQGAGTRMRRTSTAPATSAIAVGAGNDGPPDLRDAAHRGRGRRRQGAVRDRSGPRRLDRRPVVADRRAPQRRAAAADRAGRADDGAGRRRRHRPARRRLCREGRASTRTTDGHVQACVAGDHRAGRSARGLADAGERGSLARADTALQVVRRTCGAPSPQRCRAPPTPTPTRSPSAGR